MNISKKIQSLHPLIVVSFAAALIIGLGIVLFHEITPLKATSFEVDGRHAFSNYAEWPRSSNPIFGDTMRWYLEHLHVHQLEQLNISNPTKWSATEHIDMNGDGLVDLLYYYTCNNSCGIFRKKYLVLLNKGSLKFDVGYICVESGSAWHGDCADI